MSLEESNPETLAVDPSVLPNGWSITKCLVSGSREGLSVLFVRYRLLCQGVEIRSIEFTVGHAASAMDPGLNAYDDVAVQRFLSTIPGAADDPAGLQ